MSKSVIIIPARLAATRLPNKPLIRINDKALIMHVYEQAEKSKIGEVYVATCDKEIANEVKRNEGNFIMTNDSHTNGTDRVFEASKKLNINDEDFVINIQGDEPMINPLDIYNLSKVSKQNNSKFSTLAYNILEKSDYNSKNIVKVVTKNRITSNSTEKALNFYRALKVNKYRNIYHHFGVYLYKFSTLKIFVKLKKSSNEINKRLEQMRAIDNNMKIDVVLAKYFSNGIDTKKDLDEFKKLINN